MRKRHRPLLLLAVLGLALAVTASASARCGAGTVKVHSDVIGVGVALDGNPSGTMGTDDMLLPGISPGKHEIIITKPGYEQVRREVTVVSGETAPLDVKMTRLPGPTATVAPPPATTVPATRPGEGEPVVRSASGNTGLKVATWLVFGAGVVNIALGVKFGTDVQSINNDLDEFRRFQCAKPPFMLCDSKMEAARPLNAAQVAYVKAKKDDGQRLEKYQYGAYIAGGGALLTSGFLFYMAYVKENTSSASIGRRLALVPMLSPTEAGASAVLRF